MKRLIETVVFTGLAVGVHLWLLGAGPVQTGGAEGAGDEGEALLTLVASSASIERMVADWDRPPETALTPDSMAPVAPPPNDPAVIARPLAPQPKAPEIAGLALPVAEPPVKVDTEPPLTPAPVIEAAPPAAFEQPQQPEPAPEIAPERDTPPSVRPAARPETMPAPLPDPEPVPDPAPEPDITANTQSKASAASTDQKAAGQGGGGSAGASNPQNDAASRGKADKLISRWGAQIRSRIERNKRPPREARGKPGTVVLEVVVGRDGSLRGVSVARSSGIAALDQAAVGAVQRARRFPAAPDGLQQPSYTFALPVRFTR